MPLKLFGPYKLFNEHSVTGVTSYRSNQIDMLCMDTASLEIRFTGNPVGTLSVDGSNDGSVWYPTNTEVTNPTGAGSSDNILVNINWVGFRYLSLSYSNTSGSGTIDVLASARGIGG